MSHCPHCNTDHTPPSDCGHQAECVDGCHRSALMPCPQHFLILSGSALGAALTGDGRSFIQAVEHLNRDGYVMAAYFTWTAILGRYAVNEGQDPLEVVRAIGEVPVPEGVPEYVARAAPLILHATRAALVGDGDTLEATLAVAQELEGSALLSFLMSIAASASIHADTTEACTSDHVAAYHLLGSQVGDGTGFEVLPFLVGMVVAQQAADADAALRYFRQLADLPGARPLVVAVDIVGRTLGQMIEPDVTVLSCGGRPDAGGELTGVVDVERATPTNLSRELMAGVWAVRTAQAYAAATSEHAATAAVRALLVEHGDPGVFEVDVILAGTQILGYMLSSREAAVPPG